MEQGAQQWTRLMGAYTLEEERRTARYEGLNTLAARLEYKLSSVKYQFLPHYFNSVPSWRLWLRSLSGPRVLPDFACLGPVKGGSSDLSTYVLQHPCIMPPLAKEISQGDPKEWLAFYPTVKEKEQVEREQGQALCGYFNPAMHSLRLIETYSRVKPDAKIILMLRNPIDRAYSHYKWDLLALGKRWAQHPHYATFARHVDMALDFFPAARFPSRASQNDLLQTGIYVKSVDLWIQRFGRDNVHVLRAEDFFDDVSGTLCELHRFLGIPEIKPQLHTIKNRNPIKAPPFEDETRVKLQDFYRPWNEKLYTLLGRDMNWN